MLLYFNSKNESSWGEVAPLPGYSKDSLGGIIDFLTGDIIDQLEELLENDVTMSEWNRQVRAFQLPPPLRFGIDTLFLNLTKSKKRI